METPPELDLNLALHKKFLSTDDAQGFFSMCKALIPFSTMKWGRGNLPRLVYRYDEEDEVIEPLEILKIEIQAKFNRKITGVFCNYYADGAHYTPPHKDSYGCDIFTLSLGESRQCVFEHDLTREKIVYDLHSGDLLYFTEILNAQYKHSIPKTTKKLNERISLVFFCE